MTPKRPKITQELSCGGFGGSVCEGRLRLVDGEMICFGTSKVARLAGIQLFAFGRGNESPPLLTSIAWRLIEAREILTLFPLFSTKVIGAASWNPEWKKVSGWKMPCIARLHH
jgi:hypothetical protein